MNRPTDKQIEEVLAGIASPEDAKYVAAVSYTHLTLPTTHLV